ncbi:MAG: DUF167 domain-containing protein [Verrucomicrobiota bacterium]|jgi:uncharacterized protein (TIGR00251 family)
MSRNPNSPTPQPTALPPFIASCPQGVRLAVRLQPRASVNEIGEALGNELKIKVTAPPVDAAANAALLELLAEKLRCAHGRIELVRGHTSRHKTILLHGFTPAAIAQTLAVKA